MTDDVTPKVELPEMSRQLLAICQSEPEDVDVVRAYATQAVLAERERCAKLAEAEVGECGPTAPENGAAAEYHDEACRYIAEAIRKG